MVWKVVAPLMDAVSAAAAGPATAASPAALIASVTTPTSARNAARRSTLDMVRGITTGPPLERIGFQVLHAVPLTANAVGAASLLVKVPVKPMVTEPAGAMVALYGSLTAVTFSPDWV